MNLHSILCFTAWNFDIFAVPYYSTVVCQLVEYFFVKKQKFQSRKENGIIELRLVPLSFTVILSEAHAISWKQGIICTVLLAERHSNFVQIQRTVLFMLLYKLCVRFGS